MPGKVYKDFLFQGCFEFMFKEGGHRFFIPIFK